VQSSFVKCVEDTGHWAPWLFLAIFLAASFLMIWRLEAMAADGLDGTALGTIVMPYLTGLGNLILIFILARQGRSTDALTSCLVNNVTDLTLVLGAPALIWGLDLSPRPTASKRGKSKKNNSAHIVNRLSLLLTLTAVLFFTGTTWALGAGGRIDFMGGLVLVGMFAFWQCFHVFDVLKTNARENRSFSWMLPFDLALLALGGYVIYVSTDWLVKWVSSIHTTGFISDHHLGWLGGLVNVLPNAVLAFFYAWARRPEVVYTSQVGDSHICIPLCVGVYALYRPVQTPAFFNVGIFILFGAAILHFLFIAVLGRLPRLVGLVLVLACLYFFWIGLLG